MKCFTGVVAALTLLLAPSAADAQLPVGEADGVRVVREHGGIVVIFTADASKLYRKVAGRKVLISCTERTENGASSGEVTLRAPRQRRKLVTGDHTRGMDYCRVWLAPHTGRRHGERIRFGRQLIVSVPLTQRGAVLLDEESKTIDMFGLLEVASSLRERQHLSGYPTYDRLSARYPRLARVVAPLGDPGATPPAGKVGYWTDGADHVAAVTLSAAGRRLFIEFAADDVLSTNVAQYIFGEIY